MQQPDLGRLTLALTPLHSALRQVILQSEGKQTKAPAMLLTHCTAQLLQKVCVSTKTEKRIGQVRLSYMLRRQRIVELSGWNTHDRYKTHNRSLNVRQYVIL